MDRQRLELVSAQAHTFANALQITEDSNEGVRQRCLLFSSEVRNLVKAWANVGAALDDLSIQPRPQLLQILGRMLVDCSIAINGLRTDWSGVRNKQAHNESLRRGLRWVPHQVQHPLVRFLGLENTSLRRAQLLYAVAVLDVVLGVVHHAKRPDQIWSTPQAAKVALHNQLERLRTETETRRLVFENEQVNKDKTVVASQWLSNVDWGTTQEPPFETLARLWVFVGEQSPQAHSRTFSADSAEIRTFVQNLQAQVDNQKKDNEELRAWAKSSITQMEHGRKRDQQIANGRIQELQNQLEVQKQKIEADALVVEQLKYSRDQWNEHCQRNQQQNKQLREQVNGLQARIEAIQQKYEEVKDSNQRLARRNQTLQVQLQESERQNQANHDQWQAHCESRKRIDARRIQALQDEVDALRDASENLHSEVNEIEQLRRRLARAEGERDTQRLRADNLQRRLAVRSNTAPNTYETQQPQRERSRSASGTRSSATTPSSRPVSSSRGSSDTYIESDRERHDSRRPRRSGHHRDDSSSSISGWFSPRRRR